MITYKKLKINEHTSYFYSLNDRLGWGSYADVFHGKRSDKLSVAVKVIYKAKAEGNLNIEALIHQEVCCNPNIVKLLDTFQSVNNLYLITELCEGGTLRDKLDAQPSRRLDEDLAVEYMTAIVDALCTIHGKGIMHRDIKPENMFLKDGKIKLGDFGSSTEAELSLSYKGTEGYLAPEVIMLDETDYNKQVDIWSLGVVFYEMLYGEKPYKWNKEKKALEKLEVNSRTGEPLNECSVSKKAKGLLKEMLTEDPEKRITIEKVKERLLFINQKEEEDDGKIMINILVLSIFLEYCVIEDGKGVSEDQKESQNCLLKLSNDALKAQLVEMTERDYQEEWVLVDEDPVQRLQ